MALSGAERQRRYRERMKVRLAAAADAAGPAPDLRALLARFYRRRPGHGTTPDEAADFALTVLQERIYDALGWAGLERPSPDAGAEAARQAILRALGRVVPLPASPGDVPRLVGRRDGREQDGETVVPLRAFRRSTPEDTEVPW
jgi:hypothetical protein